MKKLTAMILAFLLTLSIAVPASAATDKQLDTAVNSAAAYILKTVTKPQVNSIGGEWAVIGLARSGYDVPESYFAAYYAAVEDYVKQRDGVLHARKYTDYSRVILGLTAAGYDPRDVAGYNLTLALGDFEKTIWQGANGPIWALIALDSGNYEIPSNPDAKVQATRELYIAEVLRRQLSDGGWNLTDDGTKPGAVSNSDMTGMALQALAGYKDKPEVDAAIEKALVYLSKTQDDRGGFSHEGEDTCESVVQVLVALNALGISLDDSRFIKNGNSVLDNVLAFQNSDGSFKHTLKGGGDDLMSSEQGFYGLVAAQRARDGAARLYDMTDAVATAAPTVENTDTQPGLSGKHDDVSVVPVGKSGVTFADIQGHANQNAIEALAERGIINGKSADAFDPNATMTRAEFATIIIRGLGLTAQMTEVFDDVDSTAWYAGFVGAAYSYGIVTGTSATTFNPNGTITRQEAAVMVARAAKLCGMDTEVGELEIRDTLAAFGDYRTVADWAQGALAFCYAEGLLDDSSIDIEPTTAIRRCEIAEILCRMLDEAALLTA